MRAVLFRKVIVDGINYYQLFKVDPDFDQDPIFADYDNRDSKDYFYIEIGSDKVIPKPSLLNIYTDDGEMLKALETGELHDTVSKAFEKKYHIIVRKTKSATDVVKEIKKKIIFQDRCIRELVSQIFLNQSIVNSDLPIDLKLNQKNNILFHGKKGSGKKTIIESLEKELDVPYVDICLSPEIKDAVETIITKLLERASNEEEASKGIVFIRDNYGDLMEIMGDKVYEALNFITSQGIINYHGKLIDFRTLTFVILFDESPFDEISKDDLESLQNVTNCMVSITTRNLTNKEKYMVLFSNNGRLHHYEKFLNQYGRKLIVNEEALMSIIDGCAKIDPSMNALNAVIDSIFKISIINCQICDVYIDDDCAKMILGVINKRREEKKASINVKKDNGYLFEKKIDEIVAKVKEDVIGQDESVKLLVYQIASNLIWANKENVDDPKKYIKNILIRGKPGTGKTFIPSRILKYLDVPYYVANATEYTEAGYVGKDVEDMLVDLYHAAGDDLEKAERGILVIDEIDKRASKVDGNSRDVGGSGVQEALYKFAEGTIIKINVGNRMNEIPVYFDTSRLTIICSGAFENIENFQKERTGKRVLGFGSHDGNGQDPNIIDEDYISYGMKSQFMRRVKHIIELKDVTKEQFIDIMKKSNSSALKIEQETLKDLGIEIEYTEDFYDALADKAIEMKQGVTGIEKALLKVFQNIHIQDIRASEYQKIILNKEVISDPSKVILIERGKQKRKRIK